ncbi:MAG: CvpA family protein [Bacilli bacterium]|nr:CvpA family protein [Bacilli bacterium]
MVDLLIVIFIAVGAFVGFKQGFTKSLVKFIGLSLVITLSFLLKNPVSEMLMNTMPFFPFGGLIKGLTVLNILLYEMIAFFLIFSILMIVLKVLSMTTSVFEKILSFTIILGIPSKILGSIVGALKNYIIVFFVLYFLSMPNFSEVSIVNSSNLKDPILKNTPVLSGSADSALKLVDEFNILSEKYKSKTTVDEFNLETLDLLLKYNITKTSTVEKLVSSGKIKIDGVEKVLEKY